MTKPRILKPGFYGLIDYSKKEKKITHIELNDGFYDVCLDEQIVLLTTWREFAEDIRAGRR